MFPTMTHNLITMSLKRSN